MNQPSAAIDQSDLNTPFGYPIENKKFWIMTIGTTGFWLIYWAYRNFKAFETKTLNHPKLYAFMHAFFLNISLHRLMSLIEMKTGDYRINISFPKIIFSIAFLALSVVENYFSKGILVIELSCQALRLLIAFYIQRTIFDTNQKYRPETVYETKYSWKEIGAIILTVIFILGVNGLKSISSTS